MKNTLQDTNPLWEEKRASVRRNIYLPLRLKGKNNRGRVVSESTTTVNVSLGGVFFLSTNEFTPGTLLNILLVHGTARHYLRAKVVRTDRSIKGFDRAFRHGIGVSCQNTIVLAEMLKTIPES